MARQQWQRIAKAVFGQKFGFRDKLPLRSMLLGMGLVAIAPMVAWAVPGEESLTPTASNNTYLYGSAPIADQLGEEYMVLQIEEDQNVQGVFYQIQSEFACFSGKIAQGKLSLAVVDPYEQIAYDYQMDYRETELIANAGDRPITQFVPEGFQAISGLTELARQLLAACTVDV